MPEQITKYPEVTLKVLKESGARCGEGTKQKILTHCPPEQFCAFPNGEICVYGIDQIPQMAQIKTDELARIVCPPGEQASMTSLPFSGADMALTRIVQVITEASGRISQVLGETTRDIVALFRPELAAVGKMLGALSAAVIGVFLVAFFASIALLGFLAASMPLYWAALILAGIWTFISILALAYFRVQVRRFRVDRDEPPPPS
jgi:Putative Actinobacterial Holin-X, holin superfamily III